MAEVNDYSGSTVKIDTETCMHCKGDSAVRNKDGSLMTSKEWCEEAKTCAATIDWYKVFHGDL